MTTIVLCLKEHMKDVLYRAIKMIQDNETTRIRQQDIDLVGTYCGMRQPGDEIINWNQSSREIFNFIRAICTPDPQAVSWINGKQMKVF